jgi:hypothetical protein
MSRARAGALTVLGSAMFFNERRRLVDLAAKHRLPTVFSWRQGVDAGGLMSYGPNGPCSSGRHLPLLGAAEAGVGQTVGGGQTVTSRAIIFGPGGEWLHWDGRL